MLDMLELINAKLIEENDSVLIVVYAVNQKGRSQPVIIRDLELGAVVKLDRGKYDKQLWVTPPKKHTYKNYQIKVLWFAVVKIYVCVLYFGWHVFDSEDIKILMKKNSRDENFFGWKLFAEKQLKINLKLRSKFLCIC